MRASKSNERYTKIIKSENPNILDDAADVDSSMSNHENANLSCSSKKQGFTIDDSNSKSIPHQNENSPPKRFDIQNTKNNLI